MITIRLLLQPGRLAQPVDDRGRPRCKTDTAVPMKHIRTVIAALLTPICATAAPIVTNAWVSNVRETARPYFSIQRGETVALDCTLLAGGTNAVEFPPGTVATFYWQTNGMDGAWWSTNATAGPGGHLRAVWTPAMDPWASLVSAYIGATSPGGEVTYRAAANIRIVHAPGAEPNAIDPPVRTVDFAAVAYTNAPWLLPADLTPAATSDPLMDGTASPGTADEYARGDHVHPGETVVNAVPTQTPQLPASAYPIEVEINGVRHTANGNADVHFDGSGTNTTLFLGSGFGICDFTSGVFSGSWGQSENLTFAGKPGVEGSWPVLGADAVSVRGVPVATQEALESGLASKQDAIADLAAIRSGAAAGATAYQKPSGGIPSTDLSYTVVDAIVDASNKAVSALNGVDVLDRVISNPEMGLGARALSADLATVATSGSYADLTNKPTIPTVPAISTDISADATSDAKTASPKAVKTFVEGKGYLTSYTETDPTVPAWAKAATPPVSAPSWSTAALGASPQTNLAAAAGTAYRWTGSGTLAVSSVTGLTPDPTYLVLDGFSALSLPAGFDVAGSGSFRPGREVHLALWSTPTTNLVNFLFAR